MGDETPTDTERGDISAFSRNLGDAGTAGTEKESRDVRDETREAREANAQRANEETSTDEEGTRREIEALREALEASKAETRAAREETATVRSELIVTRRSASEAKAELKRAQTEMETAKESATAAKTIADASSGSRVELERRCEEAEVARTRAERERDDARADAERLASMRDELESKLEVVTAESRAADSRSTALAAVTSERNAAIAARDAAMAKLRGLEIELEESREEQSRAEEEIMQLKRDLDELRAERDGAVGGASARGSDIDPSSVRRGEFYTEEDIATQQEEKYALLAELREERKRRTAAEDELAELTQNQLDMNARAESASRVAAVAEIEADDYRDRVSQYKKATKNAERRAEDLTRRVELLERVVVAAKKEIGDTSDDFDESLHERIRAYVARKIRHLERALAESAEESQLLRDKAKEMGHSRVLSAVDADERVAKLVEVRDKLMEELNEQVLELERLDGEISKRDAQKSEKEGEIAELETKLAQSNAQNARLLEIIEEQGKWGMDDAHGSSAPKTTASAPVTPVKSLARHVQAQKREASAGEPIKLDGVLGHKSLLASIEARLLEIHSL